MLFSERPSIYASSCMMISGGRTKKLYIIAGFLPHRRLSVASLALQVIFVCRKRPPIYASCMTVSSGRTKQHIVIGFGEQSIRIRRHSV